jgi:hypothetical protein
MSDSGIKDGDPHDHHFVPRGFLRQWCGTDNQLSRIYRGYGKLHCRRIGPKGVASDDDLYNLRDTGISPAVFLAIFTLEAKFGTNLTEYNFEKTLMQEIDTRGIAAHKKFLTDNNAPNDQGALYDLLRFIYVLGARNPHYLEALHGEVIDHLEKLLREHGVENSPLLDVNDLRRDLNAAKLTVIEAIINEQAFKERFDGMACFLYDVNPDQAAFVTADIPFVMMPGERVTVHFVPLSPARCLIMSKDVALVHRLRQRANEHLVEFVNIAMIAKADEVYAMDCREKDNADRYLGMLKNNPPEANRVLLEKLQQAVN